MPLAPARSDGKKWLAAVVVILALVLLATGGYLLLGRKQSSAAGCFVVNNGNYMLVDLQKDQTFPLVPSMGGSANVLFGPDESYVFLFMGEDTLCRVNCAELKWEPGTSNVSQVMQVDTGVFQNAVTQLIGGRAIYLKTGDDLCWFDGKTVTQIAGNVVSYSLLDSEELVYLVESEPFPQKRTQNRIKKPNKNAEIG